MKYNRKMFVIFAVMGVLIVTIAFGYYYKYKVDLHKQEAYGELQNQAEQIADEVDTAIEKMEFAMSFILSDRDVLDGMMTLTTINQKQNNGRDAATAIGNIHRYLGAWYLTQNFYKIIVYNKDGFAITNYDGKMNQAFAAECFLQSEGYRNKATHKEDKYWLIGPHEDIWSVKEQKKVVSVIKEVKGYQGTFIEVQYDLKKLNFPEETSFMIYDSNGQEVYFNHSNEPGFYKEIRLELKQIGKWKAHTDQELIGGWKSKKTGNIVIAVESRRRVDKEIRTMIVPDLLIISVVMLSVLVYVFISAKYLTGPIQVLSSLIEKRDLNNIAEPFEFHSDIMEVDSLGNSFKRLLKRLNQSVELEKKSTKLQMQAQFDALQAGVNPHFIYNVLNVVANRGMMLEDEEICRICSKLASILRYSTNTKSRIALVDEELQYLDNYFYLFKARFEEKFQYSCDIPIEIRNYRIPKLGLLQLAENCIRHGLSDQDSTNKIWFRGWKDSMHWYLSIQDNGIGFDEKKLKELKIKLEMAHMELADEHTGFEIGGMGIINTYLRFYLLFGDKLDFILENNEIGACILIKVSLED